MPANTSDSVVDQARDYYNSNDADFFYYEVWGGEDIHIGLYQEPDEPIRKASRRTVEKMGTMLNSLDAESKVLDVGAGYGGSARYLAKEFACPVNCLNLSEVQNERNRNQNRAVGLDDLIEVVDGSFEEMPYEDDSFDIIWSQDAILHSGDKPRVFDEINRVLGPEGEVIFTDPMQMPNADPESLQPVLNRIHLDSMGTAEQYKKLGWMSGWECIEHKEHPQQLQTHYSRVREELMSRYDELTDKCSEEYLDRMTEGLGHWIDAADKGLLDWGILHFVKR